MKGLFGSSRKGKRTAKYKPLDEERSLPGYSESSALSRTFFLFVTALLNRGAKRRLEATDLFQVPHGCSAEGSAERLEPRIANEQANKPDNERRFPLVAKALCGVFAGDLIRTALLKLLNDVVGALPPIVLGSLLAFLQGESNTRVALLEAETKGGAFLLAIAMFLVPVGKTLVEQQYFYRAQCLNTGFKTGLTTVVFRKATRLSAASRQGTTSGEIMNHMQLDAQKVGDLMTYFNILWSGLFQIALYLSLIYLYIGAAAFGGFATLILIVPVQTWAFRAINRMRSKQMHHADKRVKLQNEALSGIKVLKLYSWESPMEDLAQKERDLEVRWLKRVAVVQGFVTALMWSAPVLVAIVAFTIYTVALGGEMTASRVFPSLVLFNQLRFPVIFYPRVLNQSADALVSLRRLARFFSLEEATPYAPAREANIPPLELDDEALACRNASFHFFRPSDADQAFIQRASLSATMGKLICVVGPVGSGKSSLALGLLGELFQVEGAPVSITGSVAYCAQSAWIQSGTVRENILFGLPFDPAHYQEVLSASCLDSDLKELPLGDSTEIGEKGVTLSGGQKQRLALARAAYSDADVYILDDPLSALDATVGKEVFDKLICGLLNTKAVILTTHALHLLDKADEIVVLEKGQIVEQGPFESLVSRQDGLLANLVRRHGREGDGGENESRSSVSNKRQLRRSRSSSSRLDGQKDFENNDGSKMSPGGIKGANGEEKNDEESNRLVKSEKREEGVVRMGVYVDYVRAYPGGLAAACLILLLTILRQAGMVAQMYWLAVWSEASILPGLSSGQYLTIYGVMGAGVAIFTYASSLSYWLCGLVAARKLHWSLFKGVLGTRMTFFDTTPLGRILQRFQKDTDILDNMVPQTLSTVLQFLCSLIATLLTMAYVQPLLTPFFFLVGFLYFYYQRFFRKSYRELKRLEAVLASPVYAHFAETLDGLATIRAFGCKAAFQKESLRRVYENQRAFYTQRCCCDRWLPVRLETVGNFLVLCTALLGVALKGSDIDAIEAFPALIGLLLTYSLELTSLLNWIVRQWSELESYMVSTERIREYSKLEQEGNESSKPPQNPPPEWPEAGELSVEKLCLRYRPGCPLALSGVSFHCPPGTKVGVVRCSVGLNCFRTYLLHRWSIPFVVLRR